MATAPNISLSVDEYLRLEEAAEFRSEYIDGQMVAMAGGTQNHSAIGSNLVRELGNALRQSACTVFGPDMRMRTPSGIYTYADAVVSCDSIQAIDNTLFNPIVIAEVLSDSTEAYDRGKKFAAYRQIASLQEYLLVSQTKVLVEHFHREQQGVWRMREYCSLDALLTLESLGVTISVSEIYRRVKFDDENLVNEATGQK